MKANTQEIIAILKDSDLGVTSRNIELFKSFSKNEDDVKKILSLIKKTLEELETPTKYPSFIMENIRQNLGLDKYDMSKDNIINEMDKDTVFKKFLVWEGIIGYDTTIKEAIESIYDVGLTSE